MLFLDVDNNVHVPKNDEIVYRRISVYAYIQSTKKEVLTVKTKFNDRYGLPGGGVESSENLLVALKRECLEETGCEVEVLSRLPLYVNETGFYNDGKYFNSLNLFFSTRIKEETRDEKYMIGHEVINYEWKRVEDLDKNNLFNNLVDFIAHMKNV